MRKSLLWLGLVALWLPSYGQAPLAELHNKPDNPYQHSGTSLVYVLQTLEEEYQMQFSYDQELLQNKTVAAEAYSKQEDLETVLSRLLKPLRLTYEQFDGKTYLIYSEAIKELPSKVKKQSLESIGQLSPPPFRSGTATHPPSLSDAEKTITGTVTDLSTGEGLPGVNILVKGTSIGTITDVGGNYRLTAPDDAETLVFSSVGYTSEEVAIGDQTVINLEMNPDVQSLSEIVVIGYGETRKENYTGSVAAIDNQELTRSPQADISNSLVGRVPGLIATQRSGEPGADGSNLYIRGVSTTGNNNPLIVIDGIPRQNYGFSQMDPNEIESVSVLKDAAAAAVFGVRGANGVILVTTKRGEEGKPVFSFSTRYDLQVPTRLPKFLNSYEYATLFNEGLRNEGKPELFTPEEVEKFRTGSDPNLYPNSDWVDATLGSSAPQSQHNLNVRGGTDRARYFLSAGYLTQKGLYENVGFKRYNFRSNIDVDVTPTTMVRLDLGGRYEDRNYPGTGVSDLTYWAVRNNATVPIYYNNGFPGKGASPNPVEAARSSGYNYNDRFVLMSLLSITQQIPGVEGLSVKGQMAYDNSFEQDKTWQTPYPVYRYNFANEEYDELLGGVSASNLSQSFTQDNSVTLEAYLNYERTFGAHSVRGLALYSQNTYDFNTFQASRTSFVSSAVDELYAGNETPSFNDGLSVQRARRGVVGRINYDYASRYLLEANFRYDGSENFAEGKKWGFFPSVSAAWRISEENFFKNALPQFDYLKVRGSWGQLGNDQIERAAYLSSFRFFDPYIINDQVVKTVTEGRLGNTNITWEKSTSTNVGLEASVWKGLIALEVDYFHKRTTDILGQRNLSVPVTAGIPDEKKPFENLAVVVNRGVELAVGHNNRVGKLNYNIQGNLTYAKNTLEFGDEAANVPDYQRRTGQPLNQYIGYKAIGLFQSQEEIDGAPTQNDVAPGDIRYEDVNEDGMIDALDQTYIGRSNIPEIVYGLVVGAQYGNFDFNMLWQGATRVNAYLSEEAAWAFFNGGNALERHLDRWTPDNPDATYPRITSAPTPNNSGFGVVSSYWLEDASYLRLKNLEVGYTLPSEWFSRIGVSKARFFLVGQNLLTFSPLESFDPEGIGGQSRGWFYPQQKIYSAGLNVSF